MALALNTSHPLYPYLVALIGVDDDSVIKDFMGVQTCTPNASVVIGSGTYGRHFRTALSGSNGLGVAVSPGYLTKPSGAQYGSTFVAINAGNSRASRGNLYGNWYQIGPACYTGDKIGINTGTGTPGNLSTTSVIGNGAHSFGVTHTTSQAKVFVDGAVESTYTGNYGNYSDVAVVGYLGGETSGGYGGFAADYVWVAHFRKELTDAEITSLHTSLGASNAFGLIASSGATATLAINTDASVFAGLASVSPLTVLTATLANAAFSGAAGVGTLASMAITTDAALFSGSASVAGAVALTLPALKNNTGTLLANETGATVYVYATTGAHVVTKTGQTTNSSGVMVITDAALVASTQYRVVIVLASGAEGMDKVTAA